MSPIALLLCLLFSVPQATQTEEAFSEATKLRLEGRWAEASKLYADVSRSNLEPLAEHSLYHLGECLAALRRYREAASCFEDYLKRYPDGLYLGDALRGLADSYLEAGLYGEALRAGFDLLRKGISPQKALLTIGRAYEGLGDYGKAVLYYQKAMDRDLSTPLALSALEGIESLRRRFGFKLSREQIVSRGVVLYLAGRFKEARGKLSELRLRRNDRLSSKALYYIGLSFMGERRYGSAISAFSKLVRSYPYPGYTTSAEYRIAGCYKLRGRRREAERRFLAFARRYPWSKLADDALYEAGRVQEGEGRYLEAARTFMRVASRYSRRSLADEALWMAGRCYFKAGRYEEAILAWRRLLRDYPGSPLSNGARFWIAKSYKRLGIEDKALSYYKGAARNGRRYYSVRAREELAKRGVKIREIDPPSGAGFRELSGLPLPRARKLLQLGAADDASRELRRALSKYPSLKPHIYYNLSLCKRRAGDHPASIRYGLYLLRAKGEYEEVMRLVYPFPFRLIIERAAGRFGLDPYFAAAMIYEESRFDPKAISPAGAIGLMQITPSTGRELARQLGMKGFKRSMLFDPRVNVTLGCYYLSRLLKQFDGNLYLAAGAYNSGPARMREWVRRIGLRDIDEFVEDIPFPETRAHIKKTMAAFWIYRRLYGSSG